MTASIARSSASFALPPSQTTAPVLEYRCLYTHDLRRKQKRWQDGVLRFHTFNRRIMVYDTTGGLIGDKHCKQNESVEEGDELTLDRGALVEVGEAVLTTQTDISGLLQRKGKGTESDETLASPDRANHSSRPPLSVRNPPNVQPLQPRHKSLNALLGPRKGPLGKATVPAKSPYELRHDEAENQHGQLPPAKRQKRQDQVKHTGALPLGATTVERRDAGLKACRIGALSPNPDLVDITSMSDGDELNSDITMPPTPPINAAIAISIKPRMLPPPKPAPVVLPPPMRSVDTPMTSVNPIKPARFEDQAQGIQKKAETRSEGKNGNGGDPARTSLEAQTEQGDPVPKQRKEDTQQSETQRKTSQPKPLRIVKQAPRRMLLCVEEPIRKSSVALELDSDDMQLTKEQQSGTDRTRTRKRPAPVDAAVNVPNQKNRKSQRGPTAQAQESKSSREQSPKTSKKTFRRVKSVNDVLPIVDISIGRGDESHDNSESAEKRSRKSPMSKAKSLSTTDAGESTVAKKSKASKQSGSNGKKKNTEPKVDTDIGPWSTEALDLFDWRPPGHGVEVGSSIFSSAAVNG